MPYKIATIAADETPDLVFKLKRSWNDIRVLRDSGANHDFSTIDHSLPDAGPLDQVEEIVQSEVSQDRDGYVSDLESEAESITSDDPFQAQIQKKVDGLSTYVVSHPWKIVDYHLYLCSVERNKDTYSRRNGMFVYDGIDCRPMSYHEFFEENALDPSNIGEKPRFLFVALPIADAGPIFCGRHYILGFDYNSKTLFARHFDWVPTNTDDIWSVWDHGYNMYSVSIANLLSLMDSSLSDSVHVNLGFLSSSPYCISLTANDDPGMEIVIAVLFCQWMLDFADAVLQPSREILEKYKERLSASMDECRIVLQWASYRAWFASRDGYTKDKYARNASVNKFINDLYTFDKSTGTGSLDGQSWRAPSLDTCQVLRHKDRVQRKMQTEQRLEDLFTLPEIDSSFECQEQVFHRVSVKTKQSHRVAPYVHSHARRSFRLPRSASALPCGSFESLMAATSRTPMCQYADVADYRKIPLSLLLERILRIIEARPELDTFNNRSHVGALLVDIQDGTPCELFQRDASHSTLVRFEDDGGTLGTPEAAR